MMRAKDILRKLIKTNMALAVAIGFALVSADNAHAQAGIPGQKRSQTSTEQAAPTSVKVKEHEDTVIDTITQNDGSTEAMQYDVAKAYGGEVKNSDDITRDIIAKEAAITLVSILQTPGPVGVVFNAANFVYKIITGIKNSNAECKIDEMQERYLSNCYSCLVVKTLLETFMTAGAKVYDLAKEAGTIILMIGTFLTIAFMVLRNVSSFANVEPADEVNTILVLLFKVLAAFVIINAGVNVLVQYVVNPVLEAGADVGIEIISVSADDIINPANNEKVGLSNIRKFGDNDPVVYAYQGGGLVTAAVLNKVLMLNQSLDLLTSQNFIIGNALTCHATHAGRLRASGGMINFSIPDIFIWLVGIALWFLGFMLTLGISYYLLDSSFKIGFAIMFLPIAIALWPFNMTKDKLPKIFSIILRAGAVYMFLAIVTAFAMKLLNNSFGGTMELLNKIQENDSTYIAKTFSITSTNFLIIVICYLYSLKLVASSVNDYADQFFKDGTFGSGDKASPMHRKMTQMTGQVTNYAKSGAKFAKDVAVTQGKKGAGKLMKAMAKKP